MSKLVIFAASLAGIGVLVALAWMLGFRDRVRIDEARLRELAAAAAPRTAIVRVRIDAAGRAGLAWLADGRVLTAVGMGDREAVRVWRASDVRLDESNGTLKVALPDLGYPRLVMKAPS